MLIDIVILPPRKYRQYLSNYVKSACTFYKTIYVVDNKKLIPHVSLFHLNIIAEKLKEVEEQVRLIVNNSNLGKIRLKSKKFVAWGDGPTLYFDKPRKLVNLNKKIVAKCSTLRTSSMPWLPKRKPRPNEISVRRQYGVHYNIGREFRPHITLAKLRYESDARKVIKLIKRQDYSFQVNEVAICEVNRGHQVTRIIKRFRV